MFTNIKLFYALSRLWRRGGMGLKSRLMWFVGIYTASVAVIATFELGSHWLLSFLM